MDTRYPAYEVLKGKDGKISYMLYRLEPDRSKGLIIRENSRFGLFGEITHIIQPKDYKILKNGQTSRSGITAESDLYLCITDEQKKERVYRFTSSGHLRVIGKYLEKYLKRHHNSL